MKHIPKIHDPNINGATHQGHFPDPSIVLRVCRQTSTVKAVWDKVAPGQDLERV